MVIDLTPGVEFSPSQGLRAKCPFCSTVAKFDVLNTKVAENVGLGSTTFVAVRCQACHRQAGVEAAIVQHGSGINEKWRLVRLHPASKPDGIDHAPPAVSAAIEEAELCASVGATVAGALVTRRAIQLIAREKGTLKERSLAEEIKALPLHDDLKEAAQSYRIIANEAAHPDPVNWDGLKPEDLRDGIDLVMEIVRDLYERPARRAALQRRAEEINQGQSQP